MTPFYDHAGITIYHADCRAILPTARVGVDLLLTDPPYGIQYDTTHGKYKDGIARAAVVGDDQSFTPSHLVDFDRAIIWGANCFASMLPDKPTWIAWVKTSRDGARIRQADMELAWTNCVPRPRVFHHLWIGSFKASESGDRNVHPTQKPIALMQWCLSLVPTVRVVLDPYMGSGTTLIAAKALGVKAIGIEIDERYCEVAARRLRQDVLPFAAPAPVDPEQQALIAGLRDRI